MPAEAYPGDLLDTLCRDFGIQRSYWDIWGRQHEVPEQTLAKILASFGLDTSSPEALARSADERRRARQERPLDAAAVVSASDPDPRVELRAPAGSRASLALYLEEGSARQWDVAVEESPLMARLPAPLPLGYHDLEAVVTLPDGGERRASQRLIVAPDRAWLPPALEQGGRAAGLAISLYGVRSARNWGAGDFTDLAAIVEWAAHELGAGFVALNPLHAIHNRQPYNTSPYLPLSVFHRNFLYLDIEAMEDLLVCPAARALVASPAFQAELAALRASEFVEYERVARLKKGVLKLLFRRFWREEWQRDTERARRFRKWMAEQGALLDAFAVFCALDETLHRRDRNVWVWPQWPEEYRDPGSAAVRRFAQEHFRLVLFYKYVQWQIDLQLEKVQRLAARLGMPVGLYHDLALATDRCGADLWAHRRFFVEGCRVGSPPDDFAPGGQDWSFPPPNSEAHREDGYRLFAETIRRNARHGGALRIDHVMRLWRLFWIPEGMPPSAGTYVNERWEDLVRILALESVRGRFLVVGEDLGTVPEGLRETMERFGMLSYRLFYFEKEPDGMPRRCGDYPRTALVSSTTHDLPTLAGFWAGRDIEARRQAGILKDTALYEQQKQQRVEEKRRMIEALVRDGFLPADFPREAAHWTELTGELHNAVIGYLMMTPAMLMLLNQEDLTKETEQQNLPGTTWEYPNWRRKMLYSVEELRTSARARDFARMMRAWMERSGRITAKR
ncbi:MAG: 4-alpha-glucanotransferase [Bryobacteraceae bacterium]|nr:4-alpha-glucanotransferase [Bryobacteraceae bacterium]